MSDDRAPRGSTPRPPGTFKVGSIAGSDVLVSSSWFIVAANDRMIQPDLERAMAKKIKARTTELPTSHVPMRSRPGDVAAVILAAAENSK